MRGFCVYIILLASLFLVIHATNEQYFNSHVEFLTKYGYLDTLTTRESYSYNDEVLTNAIKLAQKYGGIPETGVFDNTTSMLFNSKRCGIRDVVNPQQYAIKHPWHKKNIEYGFITYSNSLEKDVIKAEISKALNEWSKISPLVFTETPDATTDNTDIAIGFYKKDHGDEFPFDGWKGVLAHAFFPGSGLGGDLHFDDDEFWAVNPGWFVGLFKIDLYTIALHELGHSIGLDHSKVQGSIMNPYYQKMGKITEDDKKGVEALYKDL